MLGGHTCGGLRIPLDAVLRSQRRGGLEVVPVRLQQIGQLDEELLESGRGNDLHQARRPIGGNYRFEVIGSDAPATPSAGKGSRSEPVVILAPELVPITPEEEQRAHLALAVRWLSDLGHHQHPGHPDLCSLRDQACGTWFMRFLAMTAYTSLIWSVGLKVMSSVPAVQKGRRAA